MKHTSLPLTKKILTMAGNVILSTINAYIELSPSKINRHICGSTSVLRPEPVPDWKINRAIRELKKRHYIEIKKHGNKILCRLTKRGITESVLTKIKTQSKLLLNNKMCIICFDIPEAVNDVRWTLRRFLKIAGFRQLQKSVWYTKKDVFDEARLFVKNLKAGEWVKVMSASIIE